MGFPESFCRGLDWPLTNADARHVGDAEDLIHSGVNALKSRLAPKAHGVLVEGEGVDNLWVQQVGVIYLLHFGFFFLKKTILSFWDGVGECRYGCQTMEVSDASF